MRHARWAKGSQAGTSFKLEATSKCALPGGHRLCCANGPSDIGGAGAPGCAGQGIGWLVALLFMASPLAATADEGCDPRERIFEHAQTIIIAKVQSTATLPFRVKRAWPGAPHLVRGLKIELETIETLKGAHQQTWAVVWRGGAVSYLNALDPVGTGNWVAGIDRPGVVYGAPELPEVVSEDGSALHELFQQPCQLEPGLIKGTPATVSMARRWAQ
ncbi:MAG: hypothetical protein AAGH68_05930 [Pseudomonadota bacterium]